MGHTQILVHRWGPEQGYWHCFIDRPNHRFSFVCGTGLWREEIKKKCSVSLKALSQIMTILRYQHRISSLYLYLNKDKNLCLALSTVQQNYADERGKKESKK